ncbi:MAG: hypothetical protein Q4D98_14475 [Planctomycetia bacterium]|nr:hypothetical protein [Planctomycetia bacterium]
MKNKTFTFEPLYSGGTLVIPGHDLPVVVEISGVVWPEKVEAWAGHDETQKVGEIHEIWIGQNGDGTPNISAKGAFFTDDRGHPTGAAKEVIAAKKLDGMKWEGSIHVVAQPGGVELIPPGKEVEINGKTFVGPLERLRRSVMVEASFVDFGGDAYNKTDIQASNKFFNINTLGKKGKRDMTPELKAYIESMGFKPEELPVETVAIFERCYKKQQEDITAACDALTEEKKEEVTAEGTPPEEKPKEEKPAEEALPEEKKETVTAEGASPEDGKKQEVTANSAFRPRKNPATSLSPGRVDRPQGAPSLTEAWTAALLLNSNLMGEKEVAATGRFSDNVMSEANSGRFCGAGLRQMLAEAEEIRTGRRCTGNEPGFASQALMRLMRPQDYMASGAFSTMNELKIIQNIIGLFYRNGYEKCHSVIDKICSKSTATNFFPFKYVTYDVANGSQIVPEGGEIQNTTLLSEEWENKVEEGGNLITITERMIIDDSTGALGKLTRKLGLRDKKTEEARAFRLILNNLATFFTSARGNRLTNALSVEGLNAAAKALAEMPTLAHTVENPDFTEEEGKLLLVPRALEATAQTLYRDTKCDLVGMGEFLETNPHVGRYEPVASSYFGAKMPHGSDTHAILLGDPVNGAILDMARLRGENGPRIEPVPTPGNIIGVSYRSVNRYGFAMGDFRAGVLLDGTAA